jgi:excinuclease ABC subunit A
VIIIEHDLDMIANADYVIDLGPGGGAAGGRIVATGRPDDISKNPESATGRYLASVLRQGIGSGAQPCRSATAGS